MYTASCYVLEEEIHYVLVFLFLFLCYKGIARS